MKPIIKPLELCDFDFIDPLEKALFSHPFPMHIYISDFKNNPFSHYFKMVLGDEIIGYAAMWITFEDCQIVTIGIAKRYQGRGFGTMLLEYLLDYARSHGCTNLTLEVRVSNEKAIALYQKLNFYKISMRKRYYEDGEDAYLMTVDL